MLTWVADNIIELRTYISKKFKRYQTINTERTKHQKGLIKRGTQDIFLFSTAIHYRLNGRCKPNDT